MYTLQQTTDPNYTYIIYHNKHYYIPLNCGSEEANHILKALNLQETISRLFTLEEIHHLLSPQPETETQHQKIPAEYRPCRYCKGIAHRKGNSPYLICPCGGIYDEDLDQWRKI